MEEGSANNKQWNDKMKPACWDYLAGPRRQDPHGHRAVKDGTTPGEGWNHRRALETPPTRRRNRLVETAQTPTFARKVSTPWLGRPRNTDPNMDHLRLPAGWSIRNGRKKKKKVRGLGWPDGRIAGWTAARSSSTNYGGMGHGTAGGRVSGKGSVQKVDRSAGPTRCAGGVGKRNTVVGRRAWAEGRGEVQGRPMQIGKARPRSRPVPRRPSAARPSTRARHRKRRLRRLRPRPGARDPSGGTWDLLRSDPTRRTAGITANFGRTGPRCCPWEEDNKVEELKASVLVSRLLAPRR